MSKPEPPKPRHGRAHNLEQTSAAVSEGPSRRALRYAIQACLKDEEIARAVDQAIQDHRP